MRKISVKVDDLINDPNVIFGDSEGVADDAHHSGSISYDEYLDIADCPSTVDAKMFTLDWKLEECSNRFLDSMEKVGVRNPLAMMDGRIMDGHHRMAAAWVLGIEIPIVEYDDYEEFHDYHEWEKVGTVHSDGELF